MQGGSDQEQDLHRRLSRHVHHCRGSPGALRPEPRSPKAQVIFQALQASPLEGRRCFHGRLNKTIRWDLEGSPFGGHSGVLILSFQTAYLGLSHFAGAPGVSIGVVRPAWPPRMPRASLPSAPQPGSGLSPGHTRPLGTPSPSHLPSTNQLSALPSQMPVSFEAPFRKPPKSPLSREKNLSPPNIPENALLTTNVTS